MPTPRKLKVMFGFLPYSGNGATSSEVPDIRRWMCKIIVNIKGDVRIEDPIIEQSIADTPVTMVRNQLVVQARRLGADVLVMCDSDMNPLKHADDPTWKEFFSSSFDFLYNHYDKGPVVIGAPYCGPPGPNGENVYVFSWNAFGDKDTMPAFKLEQISRVQASKMRGIQEAAALPTGLIMYDMRAFELIEPSPMPRRVIYEKLHRHEMTVEEALTHSRQGWFDYEWKDCRAHVKASTEDVVNTRDISLAGIFKLGYNPVFCNWDSPAGHWKPWCVSGRPQVYEADDVADCFRHAIANPYRRNERIVEASNLVNLPESKDVSS